jgi:hypothetical protein
MNTRKPSAAVNAPRIPIGDATELPVQRIVITARTFAPIVRRTAAPALIGAATMAQAHPGHHEGPQHDAGAVVWFLCAMVALSCVATVRAVAARGNRGPQ